MYILTFLIVALIKKEELGRHTCRACSAAEWESAWKASGSAVQENWPAGCGNSLGCVSQHRLGSD